MFHPSDGWYFRMYTSTPLPTIADSLCIITTSNMLMTSSKKPPWTGQFESDDVRLWEAEQKMPSVV